MAHGDRCQFIYLTFLPAAAAQARNERERKKMKFGIDNGERWKNDCLKNRTWKFACVRLEPAKITVKIPANEATKRLAKSILYAAFRVSLSTISSTRYSNCQLRLTFKKCDRFGKRHTMCRQMIATRVNIFVSHSPKWWIQIRLGCESYARLKIEIHASWDDLEIRFGEIPRNRLILRHRLQYI